MKSFVIVITKHSVSIRECRRCLCYINLYTRIYIYTRIWMNWCVRLRVVEFPLHIRTLYIYCHHQHIHKMWFDGMSLAFYCLLFRFDTVFHVQRRFSRGRAKNTPQIEITNAFFTWLRTANITALAIPLNHSSSDPPQRRHNTPPCVLRVIAHTQCALAAHSWVASLRGGDRSNHHCRPALLWCTSSRRSGDAHVPELAHRKVGSYIIDEPRRQHFRTNQPPPFHPHRVICASAI